MKTNGSNGRFQSVYGYEYQGDNLLIARMNLLYTLADYIEAKWHRQATQKGAGEVFECDLLELLADGRIKRYSSFGQPQ